MCFSLLAVHTPRQGLQQFGDCVCVFADPAEAEEMNNRLQATKQRVSELERTLSSVSAQMKQFEKVTSL